MTKNVNVVITATLQASHISSFRHSLLRIYLTLLVVTLNNRWRHSPILDIGPEVHF